ncbi:MAG: hypothetical protein WCE68_10970 [Anaerolineales bacterium]
MYLSRESLIRIAKETAEKSALSDPELVAAYLTGSLRTDNPFLGTATDIDIVFVHAREPKIRREIVALTPEIHLDIIHAPRSAYDKPRELRIHPWLGPELYDPLPLYVTRHFFEFIQAGVRDRYHEPVNVQARSLRLAEQARQGWSSLQSKQSHGPEQVLGYFKSIRLAANAVALLAGEPLAERRFLLQFPAHVQAIGQPGLAAVLLDLLGANQVDATTLAGFLPEWEQAFLEAAGKVGVDERIAAPRLGYYKLAFESMLASETPQASLWPLMVTWTLAVAGLPPAGQVRWRSACGKLGLDEASFGERLEGLDHFLDNVEALQENGTVH